VATPINYSVIKAFEILKAFRDAEGWLSSCELSRRANLPQASGYRLIQTMEEIGVIAKGKRGQYRPGMLLLSISRGVPLLECLTDASEPILTSLAESLDATIHLAILENRRVTYIGKYSSATSFPSCTRVGAQSKAYSSGLGKVLLAGLNRTEAETFIMDGPLVALTPFTITSPPRLREELEVVRIRGFAIDDCESQIKTRCVAVSVQDSHGRTIAAISASDEVSRMTPSREVEIRQALFEAAAKLQNALYRRRAPSENRLSRGDGRRAAKSRAKSRIAERRDALLLREPGPGQEHCQVAQSD
jgi:IclR family acetate operon transcriptional repressor